MSEHLYILRQRENGKLCTYISADGAPSAAYKKYIPETELDALKVELKNLKMEFHNTRIVVPKSQYDELLKERDGLQEALEHIFEYWNRDYNDAAMKDALDVIMDVAQNSLKTFGGESNG